MQVIRYPKKVDWPEILRRPEVDMRDIEGSVRQILDAVKTGGDDALRRLTRADLSNHNLPAISGWRRQRLYL